MTERHVELPGSRRPAKRGAHRLRDADPHSHVEVTLTLRGPALPDADHLPKKALSRDEFDKKYAASPYQGTTSSVVPAITPGMKGFSRCGGLTKPALACRTIQ